MVRTAKFHLPNGRDLGVDPRAPNNYPIESRELRRMKLISLPSGLTRKTATCLTRAEFRLRKRRLSKLSKTEPCIRTETPAITVNTCIEKYVVGPELMHPHCRHSLPDFLLSPKLLACNSPASPAMPVRKTQSGNPIFSGPPVRQNTV